MTLPEHARRTILDALEQSRLRPDAFDCRFDVDEDTALSIVLRGQEHNRFLLGRTTSARPGAPWEVRESPGPMFRGYETARFETLDEAAAHVRNWLKRIEEEASS